MTEDNPPVAKSISPKQKAIKEIEEAIESLKKARAWIVNNIKDGNGKSD